MNDALDWHFFTACVLAAFILGYLLTSWYAEERNWHLTRKLVQRDEYIDKLELKTKSLQVTLDAYRRDRETSS